MSPKRLLSFVIFLLFVFLYGCSYFETVDVAGNDRYNLNFNYINDTTDFKWLPYLRLGKRSLDSTETIRGKYPLLFSLGEKGKQKGPLVVNLVQTFVLPDSDHREIFVRIRTKTRHIQSASMKVICYDGQQQFICKDSVDINNGFWRTNRLILESQNIQLIKVFINCYGKFSSEDQKIWMDRMAITIDGKDINAFPPNDLYTTDRKFSIDREQIYPFRPDSARIPVDLSGKKIIALGESVHGSDSINKITVQVVKDLVLHAGCKLIIFEYPIDDCLLWDAYVTGLAPDTIINRIRKEVQSISFSDVEMVDLLVWLRNYNSSKKEKVRFMGMCWPGMHRYWTPVADYLLTYYRPEYADEFLTVLNHLWFWGELNPSKALQVFQEKTCFKKLIPPIDYELFRDVLIQCEEIVNSLKKEPYLKLRLLQFHQDYIMFRNVKKGIDLYLKEEEKAVLISHYGHVGRLSGLTKETSSMGYFLDKTYGDAYFPVGIFVGEGYANVQDAQRKDMFFFRLVPPPVNSLEKMCKETHTTNFYAPASVLPDEALFTRKVGFSGINPQFQYDRPKIHCDGFIFIHSTPRGGFIDRSKIRIDLEINTMYDQRRKKRIIEKNLNGFY